MIGLNFPSDARLSPQFGVFLGARWLRVVLLPNVDLTGWIQDAHARGLKVLGVIARESLDVDSPAERWPLEQWLESLRNAAIPTESFELPPDVMTFNTAAAFYADRYGESLDALTGGNESDHVSPSSWTMTPDDLNSLLAALNMHFANTPIIGPGLVSGQPSYLDGVDLDLIDAIALHPYGRTPNSDPEWRGTPGNFGTVGELLDAYAYHGKKVWVTEVGLSTHQVSETFQARYCDAMLTELKNRPDVDAALWFCADDAMVPFFGLFDDAGNQKPSAAAFIRAAGQIPEPEEPIMAIPTKVYQEMWQAHLGSNAEFHPEFGVEKHWMEHYKELGACVSKQEIRQGSKAWRSFVGGVIEWDDSTGARIA